jgi:hypothetical protein
VVDDATPLAPGAEFDVLGRVPAGLSAGSAEGVIVLVTVPRRAATECQEVFVVQWNPTNERLWKQFVEQGDRAQLLAMSTRLGEVRYPAGDDTPVDGTLESVVDGFKSTHAGAVRGAFCLTAATDTNVRERHLERARKVVGALGSDADPEEGTLRAGVSTCGSVLVLIAGEDDPRVARFVTHLGQGSDRSRHITDPQMQFRFETDGGIQAEAQFATATEKLKQVTSQQGAQIVAVRLATREGAETDLARRSLETVYAALANLGMLRTGLNGGPDAARELTKLNEGEQFLLTADGIQGEDIVLLQLSTTIG